MAQDVLKSSLGSLWIQPSGPNTKPEFLGCHELGDLTEDFGGTEVSRCFTSDGQDWDTVSQRRKPPDVVKTSITILAKHTADWLEKYRNASFYVLQSRGSRPNLFTLYDRATIIPCATITSRKSSGLTSREEDKDTELAFDLEAPPPLLYAFRPSLVRQVTDSANAINCVRFTNVVDRNTSCGSPVLKCQYGVMAGDRTGATKAKVYYTKDAGANWTECAAQPFGNSEDISAVAIIATGGLNVRLIAARGTTDAGNPAEIAYSDDWGATWNAVTVGTVNGTYVPGPNALCALDYRHIWLSLTDGYIFFSEDAGVTWTAQAESISGNINSVHFKDYNYGLMGGAANAIAKTIDGGATWSTVTGPAAGAGHGITKTFVVDASHFWIAYDNGLLYYTNDAGDNWYARTLVGITPSNIPDIQFVNPYCGWMLVTTASYVDNRTSIYKTINGGYDWELVGDLPNEGLNALYPCDCNSAYVVGEVYDATGLIGKAYLA